MNAPLRFGMIGGGAGAFIGAVHRTAATMDGLAVLVAGCLGSTPERALASGRALGLPADRNHATWRDMLKAEAAMPAGQRPDFITIVTPNESHAEIAAASLRAGFHTVVDKPMTRTAAEAAELAHVASSSGRLLAVTYNYTGYPLVRQAAQMVRSGEIGVVRKVVVEYHQGWLATDLAAEGQKQAAWRADPARAGAGALGDIGTHAENLVSFVTGLRLASVLADVTAFVPGRRVDDDASVLLRFDGGAKGVLSVCQVAAGEENNLTLRVYGTEGSLAWRQENPNELALSPREGQRRVFTRAGAGSLDTARASTRLPPGHPEGFFEAFANVYRGIVERIAAQRDGRPPADHALLVPGPAEGLRGMRFIEACLASAQASRWTVVE